MKANNYNKNLSFTIVHEVASNLKTTEVGGITRLLLIPGQPYWTATWNVASKSFPWSITRPETGKETFSTKCPYCGDNLAIEVESLDTLYSHDKAIRRYSTGLGIGLGILSVSSFVYALLYSSNLYIAFGLLELIFAACLILERKNGMGPGYYTKGELGGKREIKPPPGVDAPPKTEHYIKECEVEK